MSEMFYFAQKAVLHPTAPLYSPDEKQVCECVVVLVQMQANAGLYVCVRGWVFVWREGCVRGWGVVWREGGCEWV